MGDMKTPDFDDLLAAFDIPDMVDPKAAIESGHDDHESQLKPHGGGVLQEYEAHVPSSAPSVSVIVKNVRTVDAGEHDSPADKEDHTHSVAMDSRLHSVLLSAVSPTDHYRENKEKQSRDQGGCKMAASNLSSLNQFSPISSAEEFDDDDKIEVDDPMDRLAHRKYLKREEQIPKPKLSDSTPKTVLNGDVETFQTDANNNHSNNKDSVLSLTAHTHKPRKIDVKAPSAKLQQGQELNEAREPTAQGSLPPLSQAKGKSSNKLSSCIAAIAALSAKKASSTLDPGASNTPATQREPVTPRRDSPKGAKESSPRAAEKPQEPESALEVAKRLLSKPPDSPSSVISEGSVKGSPDSPSTPVIPKVRIQTIKTSSGQIKRTVTRVLPGLDSEGAKSGEDAATATTASVTVPATLSSPTSTSSVFTSPAPPALPTTVVVTSGGPTAQVSKAITIKPVATAFLPVSAVKTAGSQIINLKLANNTTVKATVIPAASVQSASSAILKAANAIQQQAIMVPASSLANAKVVPKTVHLTNLNLLPHAATKASEIHQALASKQPPRQGKQPATAGSQAPKKVSRVQVLASSQSSVVEAFNKVLSGINPVPVYVPDLSPPSAACIALPSRGYKCLECGDSFALERSLAQHYDRRSVRIEVTCNHCSKNLVFYNKCSLLSHARGHKDKGVVMQCSHLILKPIPADQMITTSPPPACSTMTSSSSSSSSSASSTIQAQASKSQSLGRGTGGGVPAAVISAPSSTPMVAAMPLEEDVTRLCRSSLKCLECSEVFQDEPSLAMHYQKAQDSNGQKTCTICQMMLPNQCSFLSHQRIHQHKSPYICPECGASCRSIHFQSHVTRNCLHYTRRVGYRCVHCSVIYADIATLKSHIQGSHCEVFYKCPICPMAFKSAAGTHSHALTQHPGVKIGDPKLIYKCSMCDTVFTQQTLLYSHFDQHLVSQKVSVFKCPDCSMHYAQKQLMMDHIKVGMLCAAQEDQAMHGTLKTVEGPPNLGINLPLSTKATNPMSASPNNKDAGGVNGLDKKPPASPLKKPNNKATPDPKKGADPGYTCADCDRLFTSREVFVAHVRREHGKQLKKHPCRLCEKSFSSSHSLCRHNRLKHKGLRKVYTCPHCPGPSPQFTKRLLLDQHMQQKHGIKTTADSANTKAASDNDSSQTLSPKRKQEDSEGPPGPRSRGSDSQPLKKQKVNVLKVHKCAVCSFTSEDGGAFREHIPQHKTDGSSFQCRECGFCFTSHPSLARHLFIVHRLKEPHGLNRRGGRGDGNDDESQRENQLGPAGVNADGTPDTQCKVCGKRFETEGSLNTHMRTHGMAFIKSKRLSSAEK